MGKKQHLDWASKSIVSSGSERVSLLSKEVCFLLLLLLLMVFLTFFLGFKFASLLLVFFFFFFFWWGYIFWGSCHVCSICLNMPFSISRIWLHIQLLCYLICYFISSCNLEEFLWKSYGLANSIFFLTCSLYSFSWILKFHEFTGKRRKKRPKCWI